MASYASTCEAAVLMISLQISLSYGFSALIGSFQAIGSHYLFMLVLQICTQYDFTLPYFKIKY